MPTKRHLVLVTLLAAALLPGRAAAGEYTVAQCDERNRAVDDARFERTDGAYYTLGRRCTRRRANALTIDNLYAAPAGANGRISWFAPDGARVVGVSVAARLRSDAGHRSRLSFLDGRGRHVGRVATGADEPGGFARRSKRLDGPGRAGFAAHLICIAETGCAASEQAHTWLRDIRLTLRDTAAPTVALSGSLTAPGWIRGSRELGVALADRGAGLRDLEVRFDGAPIAPSRAFECALVPGTRLARVMRPCPGRHSDTARYDTTAPPFRDGVSGLTVCARDLGSAANRTCEGRLVAVDNTPPSGAFLRRDPRDPELVRALLDDAHSGIASAAIAFRPSDGGPWVEAETERVEGGVQARIDSRRHEPGRYLLRLAATDVAGNSAATSARAGGGRMELDFPLLEPTALRARIGRRARYGARPRLVARLTSRGAGLRGREIEVVERFAPGSRPETRRRTLRSGRGGRISARLSRGPSRTVELRFAGDRRYLPATSRPQRVAVGGIARLQVSRRRVPAGGRVRFRGRVGSLGARIPAPGKVVELQAREAGRGRFRTVGSALHTNARGRLRTAYSFGRFYRRPVRYQFRLKVTREAGWPYRAPTHSRPRPVTVVPR